MDAQSIGEVESDRELIAGQPSSIDAHGEEVLLGVHPCLDLYEVGVEREPARERSRPEVQYLLSLSKVLQGRGRTVALAQDEPICPRFNRCGFSRSQMPAGVRSRLAYSGCGQMAHRRR